MIRIITLVVILILFACVSKEESKEIKSEIDLLSESIKKDPSNIDLLHNRVIYNKSRGNLKYVLSDLKLCLQLDSLSHVIHFELAEVYFEISKKGNADDRYPSLAKYHVERAIGLNKNSEIYELLLGKLLLAYAKYNDAIGCFNRSLRIKYNQPETHMLMGYAFKQLNQSDNAINCFRNALNIDPEFKESLVQLGQIYHEMGDTNAIVYYDNALTLDPNDEIVLYNKALFYQSITDWNASLVSYADLHKINPFHSSGHYNIGFIHMELGLFDVAANNFSDAIYSNSVFFEAYYSRGICFETLGNINQAEIDYKRAIEINPKYIYAIEALKELQLNNNKFNK